MKMVCRGTLSNREPNDPPYIARLTYTGKGVIEADIFPLGVATPIKEDDIVKLVATAEYEFNEGDVIEVIGQWKFDGKYQKGHQFIFENNCLTPLLNDETRNVMSICVENYIQQRMNNERNLAECR